MHRPGIAKVRILLFLLLISLVIYSYCLNGDFLLDDQTLVVDNEFIKHIRTLPLLFTAPTLNFSPYSLDVSYNYYRPIPSVSFALDYSIWGLKPFGFHLANVIIHALNAFFVFYLLYRLFSNYNLALLSSIFFCVHPIHTESVCCIAARAELLVSMFTLLTIIYYIRYMDSKKAVMYLLSILSFTLAILSREAGFLGLVPFFVLALGFKLRLNRGSALFHFFTFSGILIIYMFLRFTILQPLRSIPVSPFALWQDILNFFSILKEYVKLLVFPYNLHIFRSITPMASLEGTNIIFMVSLATILILSVKSKRYVLAFGIGWFFLVSLYLIKFMYKFSGNTLTMEEHWIYLASVGYFMVIAYLILNIKKQPLAKAIGILLIVIYSIATIINTRHWRDTRDFFRYNLRFVKSNIKNTLRLNYISSLGQLGLYKEAISEAKTLLSVDSNSWVAYILLGDAFWAKGEYQEAKEAYQKAIDVDYFCWQANRKLKLLAEQTGQPYEDRAAPGFSPVEANIVSLIRMGEFNKALMALESGLAVSPTPQLYTLAGITLGKMGLYDESLKAFNDAVKLNPNYDLALYNLARLYEMQRNPKKAKEIKAKIGQLK